jgi:hypothetical protein
MLGSWGIDLALPVRWNRPRATALGATLLLHVLVASWLLASRFELPPTPLVEATPRWLETPRPTPPPPAAAPALTPSRIEPITIVPWLEPLPDITVPRIYDFEGAAKDVAAAIGGGPSRRTFGGPLEDPDERPKEETPPTIWKKPLPRVGTTVTTPDGETIIWVSDYCYISLYSRSLTMQELHQGRQGVRTCVLAQFGGKKKPRDDLFDAVKRPPKPLPDPQQKPGCGPGDEAQSCAP